MPTPVTAAKQCLSPEAEAALDGAAEAARRRGHTQTTSLHMVSSLLSLPNSPLREACNRTRNINNTYYSSRFQFKALELSLGVSLDKLPISSQSQARNRVEEPPVSNSLMAAIKRSQANQRRQPEINFSFHNHCQQELYTSASSNSVVKVELQNLILSILDDPVVSRVFGEAGFRSCDIKLAVIKFGSGNTHPSYLFGYSSTYKRSNPPSFLCSLSNSGNNIEFGGKDCNFPFMGWFSEDENCRRIGEIMVRNKKRNPILLGVSAVDALNKFLETFQRKIEGALPVELSRGLSVVCVKDEVLRFVNGDLGELRFDDEVERLLGNDVGGRVVVNLGDFKALADDDVGVDSLRYLVEKVRKLLEDHGENLWLIGAVATYEVYFKFLKRFPSIEEEWDLEILPIASFKFSMGRGSYPRSSLMKSFVPLGGFFSMPSDTKSSLSNACQYTAWCHQCSEKYNQEVTALSNGGLCSWFPEQSGSAVTKAKDDCLLLNAKIAVLQKKWHSFCQQHHQPLLKGYTRRLGYKFPGFVAFQIAGDKKEYTINDSTNDFNSSSTDQQGNKNVISSSTSNLRQSSSLKRLHSFNSLSKTKNLSKSQRFDHSSSSSVDDRGLTSPNSVTTELGLGLISSSTNRETEKPPDESHENLSTNVEAIKSFISNCLPQSSSSCCSLDNNTYSKAFKMLHRALLKRVGSHQQEAIAAVVEAIARRQTKTRGFHGIISRGDVWINLRGPDTLCKKRLALALAEILYGSVESFIDIDLSFDDEMAPRDAELQSQVMDKYDVTMRGTVVDYLVEKLRQKPSVVFLENVDKSDHVVQTSLFQAVKTGRLTDLHGREVSISNSLFLATTSFLEGGEKSVSGCNESAIYKEEDVLKAKGRLIQISIIGFNQSDATKKECSNLILMNKRKINDRSRDKDEYGSLEVTKKAYKSSNSYLDLNLPAQTNEICHNFLRESDAYENSRLWMEEFNREIAQVVVFKPLDFDKLAEKLFVDMIECLHEIVGSKKCVLEIESRVMQQLLAAAYLLGNKRVEDWIEHVFRQGFVEAAFVKFSLINADNFVVKLVACESFLAEDQLLPERIMISN